MNTIYIYEKIYQQIVVSKFPYIRAIDGRLPNEWVFDGSNHLDNGKGSKDNE